MFFQTMEQSRLIITAEVKSISTYRKTAKWANVETQRCLCSCLSPSACFDFMNQDDLPTQSIFVTRLCTDLQVSITRIQVFTHSIEQRNSTIILLLQQQNVTLQTPNLVPSYTVVAIMIVNRFGHFSPRVCCCVCSS